VACANPSCIRLKVHFEAFLGNTPPPVACGTDCQSLASPLTLFFSPCYETFICSPSWRSFRSPVVFVSHPALLAPLLRLIIWMSSFCGLSFFHFANPGFTQFVLVLEADPLWPGKPALFLDYISSFADSLSPFRPTVCVHGLR